MFYASIIMGIIKEGVLNEAGSITCAIYSSVPLWKEWAVSCLDQGAPLTTGSNTVQHINALNSAIISQPAHLYSIGQAILYHEVEWFNVVLYQLLQALNTRDYCVRMHATCY